MHVSAVTPSHIIAAKNRHDTRRQRTRFLADFHSLRQAKTERRLSLSSQTLTQLIPCDCDVADEATSERERETLSGSSSPSRGNGEEKAIGERSVCTSLFTLFSSPSRSIEKRSVRGERADRKGQKQSGRKREVAGKSGNNYP